jgi:hypothetical protein
VGVPSRREERAGAALRCDGRSGSAARCDEEAAAMAFFEGRSGSPLWDGFRSS